MKQSKNTLERTKIGKQGYRKPHNSTWIQVHDFLFEFSATYPPEVIQQELWHMYTAAMDSKLYDNLEGYQRSDRGILIMHLIKLVENLQVSTLSLKAMFNKPLK